MQPRRHAGIGEEIRRQRIDAGQPVAQRRLAAVELTRQGENGRLRNAAPDIAKRTLEPRAPSRKIDSRRRHARRMGERVV